MGATAAVTLDSKAAFGLIILNLTPADNATIGIWPGVALGLGFWDRILCRGWSNSWPLVGIIDAATVMALDFKAALRLAIPNIPKAADATPCTDVGDELYPSSWNWIFGMRRPSSTLLHFWLDKSMTLETLLKIKLSVQNLLSISFSLPLIKSMYKTVAALSLAIAWMTQ